MKFDRLTISAAFLAAAGLACACGWRFSRTGWAQLFPGPPLIQAVSGGAGGIADTTPPPRWPTRPRSPVSLAVHAQPLQKPALQFALLPGPEETASGNAALRYLAAMDAVPNFKPEQNLLIPAASSDAPLVDLAKDQDIQQIIDQCGSALKMLREGSRLDGMDLGINVRQGINWTLPSLGKCRQLSEVLAIAIRMDIQKHDWAAAQDQLQTGYALAAHLGEEPTLIEALVGVSIAATMNRCVEDWIAEPGAPNLYWPLTNLPVPFIGMRRSVGFENASIYFEFPEFKEMKQSHFAPEQWNAIFVHLSEISELGEELPPAPAELARRRARTRLLDALAGIAYYGPAKQFLMDRGLARDAVEKMPVTEVLERYMSRSFEEDTGEFIKWTGLPYAQAAAGLDAADSDLRKRADTPMGVNPIVKIFMPSFGKAFIIAGRADRQIAMLRIIEAIRAYAAENGALPEKLDDLSVPVPTDSLREAPFVYSVKGGTATLDSPYEDAHYALRYEITLKK